MNNMTKYALSSFSLSFQFLLTRIVSDSIDQNSSYFSHFSASSPSSLSLLLPPTIALTQIIHQTQSFQHQQQSALKTGEEE